MKRISFYLILLSCLHISLANGDTPEKQQSVVIKPGDRGYAYSCFSGTEPKRLEVEILGILENAVPQSRRIIARVTGEPVSDAGIMAGMSGSPVYINDQLIGAMAYAFPFASEPICGITPIQEMRSLFKSEQKRLNTNNTALASREIFAHTNWNSPGMTPIATPIVVMGMTYTMWQEMLKVDVYKRLFANTIPVVGGALSTHRDKSHTIVAGSPIGVLLLDGDVRLAATGTITEIDGDRFLAFGHPVFQSGSCNLPLVESEVVSFIPNLATSFKLTNTGDVIGTIYNDGQSGAAGVLGKYPSLIPINVTVIDSTGIASNYSLKVIDNEMQMPVYTAIGIATLMASNGPMTGDYSYKINVDIQIKNHKTFHISKVVGRAANPYEEMFRTFNIMDELLNNPIESLSFEKLDAHIQINEFTDYAIIESVQLLKTDIETGSVLPVQLTINPFRGSPFMQIIDFEIPDQLSPGKYRFVIADAPAYKSILNSRNLSAFNHRNIDDYLDELMLGGSENYLHIILAKPVKDINLGHGILPNSPPSLQSLMNTSGLDTETKTVRNVILSKDIPYPYQINGFKECEIVVRNPLKNKKY
ncbi:hypothetical protein JW979_10145 [bacterium]|nr:hypothetical protein [candidate division CSSED10-310 bacterium]